MFSFINNDEVWLHCDIQACDSRTENCAVDVSTIKIRKLIKFVILLILDLS